MYAHGPDELPRYKFKLWVIKEYLTSCLACNAYDVSAAQLEAGIPSLGLSLELFRKFLESLSTPRPLTDRIREGAAYRGSVLVDGSGVREECYEAKKGCCEGGQADGQWPLHDI